MATRTVTINADGIQERFGHSKIRHIGAALHQVVGVDDPYFVRLECLVALGKRWVLLACLVKLLQLVDGLLVNIVEIDHHVALSIDLGSVVLLHVDGVGVHLVLESSVPAHEERLVFRRVDHQEIGLVGFGHDGNHLTAGIEIEGRGVGYRNAKGETANGVGFGFERLILVGVDVGGLHGHFLVASRLV